MRAAQGGTADAMIQRRRTGCISLASIVTVLLGAWLFYALTLLLPAGFNWVKWQLSGVQDYAYTTRSFCFCPENQTRVTVRGGAVVSAESVGPYASNNPRVGELADAFYAVVLRCPGDLLFTNISICSVEYDATYGLPTLISVRCYGPVTDCDADIHLYDFEVLTP